MDTSFIFTGISVIVAIFSAVMVWLASRKSHRLANKANQLQEENNRILASEKYLNWYDIENYASAIVQKMKKDKFMPNYIIASVNSRDAILAGFICQKLHKELPIIVGITNLKNEISNNECYDKINRIGPHYILVHKNLPIKESDKILIVRDHSNSGICFNNIINFFKTEYKLNSNNIKTACIAYSENFRFNKPNYSCLLTSKIYFPWGENL